MSDYEGLTKIRVEMDSDATARRGVTVPGATEQKHDGGRIVLVWCEEDVIERVCERLDMDRAVVSYEVKS